MSPQPKKGNSSEAVPALEVQAVTPAPRQGRKGSVAFPEAIIKQLADHIKDGKYAGDGQLYDTRQQANTRITRLKRALIHFGHYKEPKEIKSRVWPDGDKFRLAVTDAKAAASE